MNYLDNISIELYNILDLLLKNIRNIYNVKNDEYINNFLSKVDSEIKMNVMI